MTDEQMRIAIAEACGVKSTEPIYELRFGPYRDRKGKRIRAKIIGRRIVAPDYLNDLNAMAQAEKTLNSSDEQIDYMLEIEDIIPDQCKTRFDFALTTATARQRAEAFLRTLNLWKD